MPRPALARAHSARQVSRAAVSIGAFLAHADPQTPSYAGYAPPPRGFKLHLELAPGDGALFHLPGPVPASPLGAEAHVGTVRADLGTLSRPAFTSDGFWLCMDP